MPSVVTFKITGGTELYDALRSKAPAAAKKMLRVAIRAGARLWWAEMKQRVRQGPHVFRSKSSKGQLLKHGMTEKVFGFLSKHIAIRISVRGDELQGSAKVGPVRAGFWSRFLEFGTSRMRKFPFIRQSYESKREEVLAAVTASLREQLRRDLGMR